MHEGIEERPKKEECGVVFSEHGRWFAGIDTHTRVPVSADMAQRIQFAFKLNTTLGVVVSDEKPKVNLTALLNRFREYNCHRTALHLMGYRISRIDAAGWCQDLVRRQIQALSPEDSSWKSCTQGALASELATFDFPCLVHTVNRTAPNYMLPEHSFVVLGRADDGSYLCVGKYGLDETPIRIVRLEDELIEERSGDRIECVILPASHARVAQEDQAQRRFG